MDSKIINFMTSIPHHHQHNSPQAKIAFLQGERKGQENLKQDLVRRIKMLEFALKQERYITVSYYDRCSFEDFTQN